MINICQCHANSTVKFKLINLLVAEFGAVFSTSWQWFEKAATLLFTNASTMKECNTVQKTELSQQSDANLPLEENNTWQVWA